MPYAKPLPPLPQVNAANLHAANLVGAAPPLPPLPQANAANLARVPPPLPPLPQVVRLAQPKALQGPKVHPSASSAAALAVSRAAAVAVSSSSSSAAAVAAYQAAVAATPSSSSSAATVVAYRGAAVAVSRAAAVQLQGSADSQVPKPDHVYRGDTRTLISEIVSDRKTQFNKFEAWVPFTIEQARDFIRLCTGAKDLKDCNFLRMVERAQFALADKSLEGVTRTPLDLMEWIIRSKQRGPSISTEPTEACGGYANGYIYEIDTRDLKEVAWRKAVPTMKATLGEKRWPRLLLDADTVDQANTIAIHNIKGDTKEVSFLTTIPYAKITFVR
jgi:hypothetical protein